MYLEDIAHKHLRKLLEDNYEFVRNDGDISDEDFELLMYELIYSVLISPAKIVDGEHFPVLIGDDEGHSFIPVFTDLAEYERSFAGKDDIHPIFCDFYEYVHAGIEGIVLNPKCEQLALNVDMFKGIERISVLQCNIDDTTLDENELKDLFDSNESSLGDLSDDNEFFLSLSNSIMIIGVDADDNMGKGNGIVKLDEPVSLNSTDGMYLELFTDKDELKKKGYNYAAIVNLSIFFEYLIRMDFSGVIINPENENMVVERNVIIKNLEEFMKRYDASRYAKASDYAFKINGGNTMSANENGIGIEVEDIRPRKEWGGAHVIITSDEEKAFLSKIDEDDWYSRNSQDIYVVTKHSGLLSGLFYYVKENIMSRPDNYLYAFMALSAIDYIKRYGDDDAFSLLDHVINNIHVYLECFDWNSGMGNSLKAFEVMRNNLSDIMSDDEIRFML